MVGQVELQHALVVVEIRGCVTYKQQALEAQSDRWLALVGVQVVLGMSARCHFHKQTSPDTNVLDTLTVMTYSETPSKAR